MSRKSSWDEVGFCYHFYENLETNAKSAVNKPYMTAARVSRYSVSQQAAPAAPVVAS